SLDGAIRDLNIYYTLVSESFLIFGFSALFLASIGLYGVTSFSVNRRTRELGIRMAMGAEPRRLLTMILKQGLSKLGLGLILGLGLAFLMAGTLRISLYEVDPFDPFVFVTIVATLLIVGTLACLLPARRASLVDPIAALRDE
ncbi:MAG: FtsX-like permease family protein, partial [Acidobacteria bacterium]